jgi:hypothetical protein
LKWDIRNSFQVWDRVLDSVWGPLFRID